MSDTKRKINIIDIFKIIKPLITIINTIKMNKLKDWKTTSFAVLIALQQLTESLGIEVPQDWKDYILLAGMVLLFIAGDPKAKDFLKQKIAEGESQKAFEKENPPPVDTGAAIHQKNVETNN